MLARRKNTGLAHTKASLGNGNNGEKVEIEKMKTGLVQVKIILNIMTGFRLSSSLNTWLYSLKILRISAHVDVCDIRVLGRTNSVMRLECMSLIMKVSTLWRLRS
jgi:hypothetical protein